jgi:LTXXQ motif family protein
MRPTAIPVIGAVAFFLALLTTADARVRFGPAAALRAVTGSLGATLGGSRPAFARRHHRRDLTDTSGERSAETTAGVAPPPVMVAQFDKDAPIDRGVFWPHASDDLLEYAFFPNGKDQRFWTYGFDTLLNSAFAAAAATPTRRSRRIGDPTGSSAPDPCGSGRAAYTADGTIERIGQPIRPSVAQRDVLEKLRAALAEAIERIKAACPTVAPTTPAQRFKAIQDRIWAMRDALLIIRRPFEQFYGSLTDEQLWRVASADPDATDGVAIAGSTGMQACGEQAGAGTEWPIRAIERALRPTEEQRAILQALQMRLAGMARLIGSSCPDYPLLGAMGRLAAVGDRLDVMLFAVMALSPALPDFYESLSDRQKAGLNRVIRQARRATF